MDEAGVCPNLMTRFREEYYESKAYKASIKAQREEVWKEICAFLPRSQAKGPPEVRVEYFAKSREGYRKGRKANSAPKAQRRMM